MFFAAQSGQRWLLDELMKSTLDLDLTAKNNDGKTVLDLALESKGPDAAAYAAAIRAKMQPLVTSTDEAADDDADNSS